MHVPGCGRFAGRPPAAVPALPGDGHAPAHGRQVQGAHFLTIEHSLRFSELRLEVPCATPKMLTQQLLELEADGLLSRKVYPVVPPRVESSLTDFGRSIRYRMGAPAGYQGGSLRR